ncbi:unnamed protein product [Heligmosomoides polygyrus]|uniref:GDT1 family protein n=1 Tax=Heligmosomoides polygyrus TaxID=6339 RepID=A0A183GQB3_HELPZ|nr:unnamed protein product [Heligmosomoides polygyrus]
MKMGRDRGDEHDDELAKTLVSDAEENPKERCPRARRLAAIIQGSVANTAVGIALSISLKVAVSHERQSPTAAHFCGYGEAPL